MQLAVCDMDGTLLNSQKEFSAKTVETMQRATRSGLYVTLCSGRVYAMLESYWRGAGIAGPIIAANGAHIVDTTTGKTLWEAVIDPQEAVLLLDFCRGAGMDYSALCEDGCYFSPISVRRERFEQYNQIAVAAGCQPIPLFTLKDPEDHRWFLQKKTHKILIYELRPGELEAGRRFIDGRAAMDYTSSEPGLLDISARGVSKGEGLLRLARLMGIPRENTCAFGDFENDIPMFEAAGYAVAMGNGSAAAKAAAHRITGTNDQDGVAAVLEELMKSVEGERKDEI